MKLAKYSKAIAGAVGVIALVASQHVPIEVGLIEQVIFAILTVTGIYAVPNAGDES